MLKAESSVFIDAPRKKVFDLLAHPELLAGHMDTVHAVSVISRNTNSVLTETVAGTDHRDTTFILESRLFPPGRIDIRQLKGELRRLRGSDRLEEENGGTRVTETLEFDIGLPFFGDLVGNMGIRQLIQQQSQERLNVLKRLAETDM